MLYSTNMATIPKIIHYFTFGGHDSSDIVKRCVASWERVCPTFVIKKWDESNFDIKAHPFTDRMYKERKFAFVADYARLYVLEKEGGIYLDTDMELVSDISPLLDKELVLGEEEVGIISAGMIASIPHNIYIKKCKERYDKIIDLPPTIPRLMTEVFNSTKNEFNSVRICPPVTFYPYSADNISSYKKEKLSSSTYGVHLWNYSWGHPMNRLLKKVGLYKFIKKITESLGIKAFLKKLLNIS